MLRAKRLSKSQNQYLAIAINKIGLYYFMRKIKIFSLLILLFLGFVNNKAFAQEMTVQNLPYADLKTYHVGFHVGFHNQDIKIVNSGYISPDGENYYAASPEFSLGFSVGILGDMAIIPNLNLRLAPTLHIGDRNIEYTDGINHIDKFYLRSYQIEIPLILKYSSHRLNNIRPYIIGGGFTSFNIGSSKEQILRFKTIDLGLIVGLGTDIYFPYFKLSPELSFHYGLINSFEKNRPDLSGDKNIYYTNAIDRINSRMLLLTFYFE